MFSIRHVSWCFLLPRRLISLSLCRVSLSRLPAAFFTFYFLSLWHSHFKGITAHANTSMLLRAIREQTDLLRSQKQTRWKQFVVPGWLHNRHSVAPGIQDRIGCVEQGDGLMVHLGAFKVNYLYFKEPRNYFRNFICVFTNENGCNPLFQTAF